MVALSSWSRVPSAHAMQLLEPPGAKVPAEQAVQVVAPVLALNSPAGQSSQAVAGLVSWSYCPASQSVQIGYTPVEPAAHTCAAANCGPAATSTTANATMWQERHACRNAIVAMMPDSCTLVIVAAAVVGGCEGESALNVYHTHTNPAWS